MRLTETEAIRVMKAAGLFPLEPYVSVNAPWLSKCQKCGREVSPRLGSIKRGSAGCAFCSGRKVDPDEAVVVMQNAGLEPQSLTPAMMFPGSVNARNVDVKLFLGITMLRVVAVAASIVLDTL